MGAVWGEGGKDSEALIASFFVSPAAFFVSHFVILFLYLGPFSGQEPPGSPCLFRQIRQIFYFSKFYFVLNIR